MQRIVNHLPAIAPDPTSDQTFNVVIAYEDFETGKHAKKTYDFLVENLGSECQFRNQMWKFDVLSIAKLRDIAVKDAVEADVIIISCHGGPTLPQDVRVWIEGWLAERTDAIALVALFDRDPSQTENIRAYLAGVARRGCLELFAQPDEWPGSEKESRSRAALELQNHRAFTALAGVVHAPPVMPRWGLNE